MVAGPTLDPGLLADVFGEHAALELEAPDAQRGTTMSVTDIRHPVFQAFGGLVGTLGQVRVDRSLRVVETDGARVIARFEDGSAALVEYAVGAGRAFVFASDLNNDWNDFPRRPTFVPFVHELTRYLVGEREERQEVLVEEVPAGLEAEPGILRSAASEHQVVVNVDARESDLSRSTVDDFLARVNSLETPPAADPQSGQNAGNQEADQRYWWYVLLAMLIVLVAESWLGRSMA